VLLPGEPYTVFEQIKTNKINRSIGHCMCVVWCIHATSAGANELFRGIEWFMSGISSPVQKEWLP